MDITPRKRIEVKNDESVSPLNEIIILVSSSVLPSASISRFEYQKLSKKKLDEKAFLLALNCIRFFYTISRSPRCLFTVVAQCVGRGREKKASCEGGCYI